MKKDTKIVLMVLPIVIAIFGALFGGMQIYISYHNAKFFEQVKRIEIGMPFEQVKEILPYKIYRECVEPSEIEYWAATEDQGIIDTCHLYVFCDTAAMQFIFVYVDKESYIVRHISTRHA